MLAGYKGERPFINKRFRNTGTSTADKATRSRRRTMRPLTRPKKRVNPCRGALHTRWAASAVFCSRTCSTKENAVALASTEGSAAVKELLKLQTAQLDEFFVILKAKHDKPREGRPWVWSLLAEVVLAEMRAALQAIARWSKENWTGLAKGVQIAPQHSQDGNVVEWSADGNDEMDEMDGHGSRVGQKRGRSQ